MAPVIKGKGLSETSKEGKKKRGSVLFRLQ